MSRERIGTAGSHDSFGLRERSHTGGSSVDFEAPGVTRSRSWSRDSNASLNDPLLFSSPTRSISNSVTATRVAAHVHAHVHAHAPPPVIPEVTRSSTSSTLLRSAVYWIQRQSVPGCLLPTARRILAAANKRGIYSNITTAGNPNEPADYNYHSISVNGSSSNNNNNTIYCIRGLDRVVFGTTAAADCVWIMGLQPPRYLWYMVSGAMCDICQLLMDITLHFTVFPNDNDAAFCWMFSFCLSIIARHTSHRYLVFGDYVPNYWQSLGRMYAGYSISIVLSTIFNYVITQGVAKVSHYVAYVATLLWTGLANYFILKRLWKMGGSATAGGNDANKPLAVMSAPISPNPGSLHA